MEAQPKPASERPLDEEGYCVKAMMLGMQYGRSTHTFYHDYDDETHDIDADTLEHVPMEELERRRDIWMKEGGYTLADKPGIG